MNEKKIEEKLNVKLSLSMVDIVKASAKMVHTDPFFRKHIGENPLLLTLVPMIISPLCVQLLKDNGLGPDDDDLLNQMMNADTEDLNE